ncbi:carbonic anhydrase-related protein-like isoform X1 [Branchiostoma floridae x Branchiostoma belcheri]
MATASPQDKQAAGEDWGYTGASLSEWGLHWPYANGDQQSPVNINSRTATFDETLVERPLTISYCLCREWELSNDGHAVQVVPKPKTATFESSAAFRDSRSEQVLKLVTSGGPLPEGHEFELCHLRFHWGREDDRGSEHTVNFKAFPMELHLLHWNTSLYSNLADAMGKRDGIVIMSVIVQIGRENAGVKNFTDHLEDIQYKGKSKTITTAFNPTVFLPDPALREYWTYEGSLTSPPCYENVQWIIFRYPLTISHVQMEEFRRLRCHAKGQPPPPGEEGMLCDNFRPTQPIKSRIIRASFQ